MKFLIMRSPISKSSYKPIQFIGTSRQRLKEFPDQARRQAGYELGELQKGRMPYDWKPMSAIGPGTIEIRIHEPHEHRVICVSKFSEAIYVIHVFEKKSQKTLKRELEIARKNYAQIASLRKEEN